MQVILTSDIPKHGKKDTVISVSDGYARNYLFPRKLAIVADAKALQKLDAKKKRMDAKVEENKDQLRQTAEKLDQLSVEVKADVGEEGKLFGSITSSEIANEIKNLLGIDVDKKKIILDEPIKVAGKKDVEVKFTSDIKATLSVLVSPK